MIIDGRGLFVHINRYARQEEHNHIRMLSRALRGCHFHHNDKKTDALLLFQLNSALCIDIFYGTPRVHIAS